MRVWCEVDHCYYEIESVWNGTLARQKPDLYSLLGEGWQSKEPLLPVQSPPRNDKGNIRDEINASPQPDTGTGCKCQVCGGYIYGFAGNKCGKCRIKQRTVRPLGAHRCGCGQAVPRTGQRCTSCRILGKRWRKVKATKEVA